jgi:hypothetical protein
MRVLRRYGDKFYHEYLNYACHNASQCSKMPYKMPGEIHQLLLRSKSPTFLVSICQVAVLVIGVEAFQLKFVCTY